MKGIIALVLTAALLLTGCSAGGQEDTSEATTEASVETEVVESLGLEEKWPGYVRIRLNNNETTVDYPDGCGVEAGSVVTGGDIVYYEEGHDFTYGEGDEADAHSADEANAHTVVTITQPGTYVLAGQMEAGQVAVDLGEEAETDPEAVVTLILDNVDITCTVAPAVIFYNVYECGSADAETATYEVDTTGAGANVILADGSVNNIYGSYVARIYEADSVVLSEDGTEVADAKKLHKYDAAIYSKMSMNLDGNDGVLNITAENEGLDTELHLTVNGGNIHITSGNDGINTNEDGVSVTTVNGGKLNIAVEGSTGEGDGIDSNGWLVINGGTVTSAACSTSGDAGIDSEMGIYINGGTVLATGNMLDRIAGGDQTYAVFTFAQSQSGGSAYTLKNAEGNEVLTHTPVNDFTYLIIAGDGLTEGDYTFYRGETQLSAVSGEGSGGMMPGGQMRFGMEGFQQMEGAEGEMPEQMERPRDEMPEDMTIPEGEMGEAMTPPEGMEKPEGQAPEDMGEMGEMPEGGFGGGRGQMGAMAQMGESSTTFPIARGANYFSNVAEAAQ